MDRAISPSALAAYEADRKSTFVAYLLWFFLGLVGAHRFYVRATRSAWTLAALHLGGWALIGIALWSGASWTTVGGPLMTTTQLSFDLTGPGMALAHLGTLLRGVAWLWWLVDLLLTAGLIRRFNARLALQVESDRRGF